MSGMSPPARSRRATAGFDPFTVKACRRFGTVARIGTLNRRAAPRPAIRAVGAGADPSGEVMNGILWVPARLDKARGFGQSIAPRLQTGRTAELIRVGRGREESVPLLHY